MRLCKDCKWSSTPNTTFSNCNNPKNIMVDIVTGSQKRKWDYCSTQRLHNRFDSWLVGECGKIGRWWETKE